MATIDTDHLISVTEAGRMGVSALIREAETGHDYVVLRNNKPVAAVVGIERLEQLQRLEDDLVDVSLAAARALTTSDRRYSLDDVLARFGYTREQLTHTGE